VKNVTQKIKAYMDLLRLHFFFVWPTLFCAGLFYALGFYNGFSWTLLLQAVLISFFGFEAGLILNDIIDADLDKKELPQDTALTRYWRPFGKRPIPQTLISKRQATSLFTIFVAVTVITIFTLPFPHALYVFTLMLSCYVLEAFYQYKKRNQTHPIAQIVGRIDFALFLVAGYLCIGNPDLNALLLFLFFYPLALAHLGVNDLVDTANDKAKKLNTIPTLYSIKTTTHWILLFSIWHAAMALILLTTLGTLWSIIGFAVSLALIAAANANILKQKTPQVAIKMLPLFHLAMLIYAVTIIANYAIAILL
jgi:4-hydroxybenzoate polyprenyltransferase